MGIFLSILVIIIGFAFFIASMIYYNKIKHGTKEKGVAVRSEKVDMSTIINRKFKKEVVYYKTQYKITTYTDEYLITDPEFTTSQVTEETEKEFYFSPDDMYYNKPYSMETFKNRLKTGAGYTFLGIGLLIFDLLVIKL